MPVTPAVPIVLDACERHRLKKMAYGHKTPYQARQRATIVLLAARGRFNARTAAQTRMHVDTVRAWRGRFAADGWPPCPTANARGDRPRSARCRSHTPVHASWTNQIEIFFSIVQRKVVRPNDFTDLNQVRDRLRAFEDHYNATAQPFQWRFATADPDDLLARLDRHTPDRHQESSARLTT